MAKKMKHLASGMSKIGYARASACVVKDAEGNVIRVEKPLGMAQMRKQVRVTRNEHFIVFPDRPAKKK